MRTPFTLIEALDHLPGQGAVEHEVGHHPKKAVIVDEVLQIMPGDLLNADVPVLVDEPADERDDFRAAP